MEAPASAPAPIASGDASPATLPADAAATPDVPGAGGRSVAVFEEASPTAATPLYAHAPAPDYPRQARERGWEGEVLLRVRVTAGGDVAQVEVERSSGYPVLDRAARRGVEGWRFQPARRGPVAVESTVLIPIPFILRQGAD